MPPDKSSERRKFERFETDLKIQFYVSFDVETKIDYRVKEKTEEEFSSRKYHALSRNVSVEGISFISPQKLHKGDQLLIEVFVPSADKPILMEGEVRWSHLSTQKEDDKDLYDTGVRLVVVAGQQVEKSIFVDNVHNMVWSIVLESVFGSFKHLALKRKKD